MNKTSSRKIIEVCDTGKEEVILGFTDLNEAVELFEKTLSTLKQLQKKATHQKWIAIPFKGKFDGQFKLPKDNS